jgi:hypothetical protein
MNLNLNLRPELEDRLREKAAREGVQPEACVLTMLEVQLTEKSPAEFSESEPLWEATRGLPESVWKRYHELLDRQRKPGRLDEVEHSELLELNELVETSHARQMTYLAELAIRRGMDLRDLMDQLGFPNHGRA